MNYLARLSATLAVVAVSGCGGGASNDVGTIDIQRIMNNWPKFINYSNQIAADEVSIERSRAPFGQKQSEQVELRKRYVDLQNEVQGDLHNAASQVASDRHMKLIVTKEPIGYGGVDVTADVEKILKITEASPAPPK